MPCSRFKCRRRCSMDGRLVWMVLRSVVHDPRSVALLMPLVMVMMVMVVVRVLYIGSGSGFVLSTLLCSGMLLSALVCRALPCPALPFSALLWPRLVSPRLVWSSLGGMGRGVDLVGPLVRSAYAAFRHRARGGGGAQRLKPRSVLRRVPRYLPTPFDLVRPLPHTHTHMHTPQATLWAQSRVLALLRRCRDTHCEPLPCAVIAPFSMEILLASTVRRAASRRTRHQGAGNSLRDKASISRRDR